MRRDLQIYDHVFEGSALSTIIYKGRPCWIARQVGVVLGYAQGGRDFVGKIRGAWRDEFEMGQDFELVSGENLSELKRLLAQDRDTLSSRVALDSDTLSSRVPSITLLYESGLWLALAKSEMPASRKLRRFLVDDVLPQIARDGQYSPGRRVTPEGRIEPLEEASRPETPLRWLYGELERLGVAPARRAELAMVIAEEELGEPLVPRLDRARKLLEPRRGRAIDEDEHLPIGAAAHRRQPRRAGPRDLAAEILAILSDGCIRSRRELRELVRARAEDVARVVRELLAVGELEEAPAANGQLGVRRRPRASA